MKFLTKKTNLVAALVLSLTAGMSVHSFAVPTNVTTNAQNVQQMHKAERKHINFEQRYQQMLARDLAAANAKISAAQAVNIAQQQVPNSQIMGVQYSDGKQRSFKKQQNAATVQNQVTTPSYRIMAIKADGKPQMILVDAATGQVTQKDMSKWTDKANQNNQKVNKPVRQFTAPAISATKAMQLAADKVGGEVIAVNFGHGKHHGGKHDKQGKRGFAPNLNQAPQTTANAQTDIKDQLKNRNYRVKVVKGQEVYVAKVNAQTGEVTDIQSMKDMPKRTDNQRAAAK